MKRFFLLTLTALISLSAFSKKKELSEADHQAVVNAINLADNPSKRVAALDTLTRYCKIYTDHYELNYERLLVLYQLKEYEQVIKEGKKWIKAKDNSPLIYQLCGNALDMIGKPNEAIDLYGKGVKKFPDAGMLYLEAGNVYMQYDYNEDALKKYNAGIANDPDFPSNYYRAAELYFNSPDPVWGLIYGETEILLNPNNEERFSDMSKAIASCLNDNINVSADSIKATLTKSRDITLIKDSKGELDLPMAVLGFEGIYEGCVVQAVVKMIADSVPMTKNSVNWLSLLRKNIIDVYYDVCKNMYGDCMYLLEFQKKIIDAGHWDAYNRHIFYYAFPAECEQWLSEHETEFNNFVEWYNSDNTFMLGNGKSVGKSTIFNCVQPLSLLEAMKLQADLLVPKEKEESTLNNNK